MASVEKDFCLEPSLLLAPLQKGRITEEGAYLHVGTDELVIQVVGIAKEEMADGNVLWLKRASYTGVMCSSAKALICSSGNSSLLATAQRSK